MKPHELALVFVEKAAQDQTVLSKLADDPEVADEILGFHGQQAVEKLLKAVLINRNVDPERTHNISRLMKTVEDEGLKLPEELKQLDVLTPYAVELRYSFFLTNPGVSLNRSHIISLIRHLHEWAKSQIGPQT